MTRYNLGEVALRYGGIDNAIEQIIMSLCDNYFSYLEYADAYFWELGMDDVTDNEIKSIMECNELDYISKSKNLLDLLKEKGTIKRYDENYKEYLLQEINDKIKDKLVIKDEYYSLGRGYYTNESIDDNNKEKIKKLEKRKNEIEKINV